MEFAADLAKWSHLVSFGVDLAVAIVIVLFVVIAIFGRGSSI